MRELFLPYIYSGLPAQNIIEKWASAKKGKMLKLLIIFQREAWLYN